MAIKKKQDLLRECDTQRDSLFTSLGRLLYENIQSGGISYSQESEDPVLTAEARRLIRDVVVSKISDRKPKLDPFVMAQRKALQAKADARAVARDVKEAVHAKAPVVAPVVKKVAKASPLVKAAKPAPAVKPAPVSKVAVVPKATSVPKTEKPAVPGKPGNKNTMAAVLKGVQHVIASAMPSMQEPVVAPAPALAQAKPAPVEPTVERRDPRNLGVERRGQLEPYTKLLIEHHVTLRKLREIKNDVNDGITVGLLYATGDKTAVCQAAVDEKLQTAISLMEKKQEAIRLVMENKKQFFADNKDAMVWRPEEEFLKELELDAAETSRRIDGLINEVVDLFRNIKSVYSEDVRAGLARPQVSMSPVVEPAPVDEAFVDEAIADEPAEDPVQEPALSEGDAPDGTSDAAVPDEATEEDAPAENDSVEVAQDDTDVLITVDEDAAEKLDYGLFETGARKLLSEAVDQNEKLAILHTLFRNAPRRVVPYLYELVGGAEMFMRRQLIALLGKLDYPTMVDLYRRFITDDNSSMRLAGMMGLVTLDSDEAKHVIVSAVNDRDANVRRFIVNHLNHDGNEPDASAVARLSRDVDETVARIALRKLGLMATHQAFVTVVPLLESPNIKVRKEAISALHLMTGTDLGFDCGAPEVERARAVRQWKILSKESYMHPRFLRDLRLKYANIEKAAPLPVPPVKKAQDPKPAVKKPGEIKVIKAEAAAPSKKVRKI